MEKISQKIKPNLWFNNEAEEAVNYYISIFKNSKIERINLYSKAGQDIHKKKEGSVMTILFMNYMKIIHLKKHNGRWMQ